MRYAIIVQNLYELIRTEKQVNPFNFQSECEQLYCAIKTVGIDNLDITYIEDGEKIKVAAIQMTDMAKAVSIFPVVLKYRWTDLEQGRLNRHYKMDMEIGIMDVLGDLGITKGKGVSLKITNVLEFMKAYKEKYRSNMRLVK